MRLIKSALTCLFRICTVSEVAYSKENLTNAANWQYTYYMGYKHLGAGLCCGLSSLAAGLCIGVVGDAGVRGNAQRDILIALILMMIFAEALALYGFIVAIVLSSAWEFSGQPCMAATGCRVQSSGSSQPRGVRRRRGWKSHLAKRAWIRTDLL